MTLMPWLRRGVYSLRLRLFLGWTLEPLRVGSYFFRGLGNHLRCPVQAPGCSATRGSIVFGEGNGLAVLRLVVLKRGD